MVSFDMGQNKHKEDFERLERINKQMFEGTASLFEEMGLHDAHERVLQLKEESEVHLKRFAESAGLPELDGQKDSGA